MSQPSFLQNLAQALRQPTSLSTLASIGVHGLLWVVLPVLPISSNTPEQERRVVQLVELSPEEQSRVPQFTQPQNLFPNNPIQGNILPPSSPLTQPAPLPPPIDPSLLYPLPISPPPNIWSYTPEPQPRVQPRTEKKPTTRTIQPERTEDQPSNTPETKDDRPSAENTPETTASNNADKTTAPNNANETTEPNPTTETRTPLTPEQITAYRQAQEALRQKFIFDGSGQTPAKFESESDALLAQAKDVAKDDALVAREYRKVDKITNFYPTIACPAKLNSDRAEVGVVVSPEGKVVGEPKILYSSGYPILDEAALQYVAQGKFPTGKQFQPTIVPFEFKFSEAVCPAQKSEPSTS